LPPGHSFTGHFWPGVEAYEPEVRAALRYFLQPGHTFIDCGANLGYFSVMASGLVGPSGTVVAVEANPETLKLLRKNLHLNGAGTPIHCALTSRGSEVTLFVSDRGDVFSSLHTGGLVDGPTVRSFRVPGQTLDELVSQAGLQSVNLVKVDIEGGELDVLRSAPRLMSELRPTWIVEYGTRTWSAFGATEEGLLELARQRGYAIRLFDPKRSRLVEPSETVWKSHYVNVCLVPEERAA
jgi:FkbM family methyltransferase